MSRIKELDGLRAIAILGVVLMHYTPTYTGASTLVYFGWSGVDLFFAISGFLITNILIDLRRQETPFRTFYSRRALRIFPNCYLVLVLVVVAAVLHKEQVNYRTVVRHALFLSSLKPGLLEVIFQRLVFHVHPISTPYHQPTAFYVLEFKDCLGVYWSLSVEELFYLIWAPIILRGTRRVIVVCSIAPVLVCPMLRALAHTSPTIDETVGFIFRFDSLAAGGCVAIILWSTAKGYLKRHFTDTALILTTGISLLGLWLLSTYCGVFRGIDVRATLTFSIFGYSLLAVFCATVVGACARWKGNLGVFSRILRCRAAVYLGTVSYTMYLTHLPVYVAIQLIMLRWFGPRVFEANHGLILAWGIAALACTLLLAGLSWRYFESPILRLKNKRFPVQRALAPPLPAVQPAAP